MRAINEVRLRDGLAPLMLHIVDDSQRAAISGPLQRTSADALVPDSLTSVLLRWPRAEEGTDFFTKARILSAALNAIGTDVEGMRGGVVTLRNARVTLSVQAVSLLKKLAKDHPVRALLKTAMASVGLAAFQKAVGTRGRRRAGG